ncbi:MAG: hypothetical protein JXM69_18130 [Anaerolineae bacterium]|nr:hypothetical protein [Anaerolineae bacterium]
MNFVNSMENPGDDREHEHVPVHSPARVHHRLGVAVRMLLKFVPVVCGKS